jgi:hypothetical protein
MNKTDAIRQRNRDLQFKEIFLDPTNAKKYFDRSLGFDVKLIQPKDIRKGFYSIHGARKVFEATEEYHPVHYTFEKALEWLAYTSPFKYWEDGEYLNMEFYKEFYEAHMNDFSLEYYERHR